MSSQDMDLKNPPLPPGGADEYEEIREQASEAALSSGTSQNAQE